VKGECAGALPRILVAGRKPRGGDVGRQSNDWRRRQQQRAGQMHGRASGATKVIVIDVARRARAAAGVRDDRHAMTGANEVLGVQVAERDGELERQRGQRQPST
jgi:hypothetical protein